MLYTSSLLNLKRTLLTIPRSVEVLDTIQENISHRFLVMFSPIGSIWVYSIPRPSRYWEWLTIWIIDESLVCVEYKFVVCAAVSFHACIESVHGLQELLRSLSCNVSISWQTGADIGKGGPTGFEKFQDAFIIPGREFHDVRMSMMES